MTASPAAAAPIRPASVPVSATTTQGLSTLRRMRARTARSSAAIRARSLAMPPPTGTMPPGRSGPVSTALMEAAQRLLARQIGPIASVVVRKAAAAAPQRDAFIARLAEAVDDAAARRLLVDELNRLP